MAGGTQQVGAVEEHAGVDVPRQAEQAIAARRGHDVGVEDAGEIVVARDAGVRHPRIERLERVERGELGQPCVAQLAEVGQRVAGVGGQQLLVRRGPRQLLHDDADAGMPRMEFGQQFGDDFRLAAHRPEVQRAARIVAPPAAGERTTERTTERDCAQSTQRMASRRGHVRSAWARTASRR